MKPLLSVVMGVFNAQDVVGSTIDSILSQSGPDSELIIVDDGSVDNTYSIAKKEADIVLPNRKNFGKGKSLRRGIKYLLKKHKFFELSTSHKVFCR